MRYKVILSYDGSSFRGCAMFDMETGAITDVYYRYDQELADLDEIITALATADQAAQLAQTK